MVGGDDGPDQKVCCGLHRLPDPFIGQDAGVVLQADPFDRAVGAVGLDVGDGSAFTHLAPPVGRKDLKAPLLCVGLRVTGSRRSRFTTTRLNPRNAENLVDKSPQGGGRVTSKRHPFGR